MNSQDIKNLDKNIIWHPFTQHGLDMNFPIVKNAQGAWLYLENNEKKLDAVSSWWVTLHGHCQPEITNAISQQANQLDQILFANFSHEKAILLAKNILEKSNYQNTQNKLTRCFYSDNGSTAVEVAMKMAFQYFKNKGINYRSKFLALKGSYHGDTLGAMSVSERGGFHHAFAELMPEVDYVEPDDRDELYRLISQTPCPYSAVIVEPLIQGASGMRIYSQEFLKEIARLCKETNTLLIADEVFTGFYRTGKFLASHHAQIQPDIVCLAKGITGGLLPLAVTLTTEDIFSNFKSTDLKHTFLHGHSYTANPISCAAALASFDLLHTETTQNSINRISQRTTEWIKRLSENPQIIHARSLGTIGAVTLKDEINYMSDLSRLISKMAIENDVLLRPLGNVIYAVPPYCVTDDEIDLIYATIEKIVNIIRNI